MKKKYSICATKSAIEIVLIGFLLVGLAVAIPQEKWNRTFGGNADDLANSVLQTSDGGFIVAGQYNNFFENADRNGPISANNFLDAWIIKVDENGEQQWNTKLGGAITIDRFTSFQRTNDGGFIFCGSSNSYGRENADAWIVKTDPNGATQRNKTFGGEKDDKTNSIIPTSDGGYIIAGGYSAGKNDLYGTNYNAWLLKIDGNLTEQWRKTFGGVDEANAVQQTSDEGYLFAGKSYKTADRGTDAYLIKIDAKGNEQWKKTFGGTSDDTANSLQKTDDGGFIFAGNTRSHQYGNLDADAWLVRTDHDGTEQWRKTYGGTKDESIASIQVTSDGGFILAGYTESSGAGKSDAWIIMTDSKGEKIWSKTFGGENDDRIFSVQQITDTSYILAGQTYSYGNGSGDAWLIKVSDDALISIKPNSTTQIISAATIISTATPMPTETQFPNITKPTSTNSENRETLYAPGFVTISTVIGLLVHIVWRIK